MIARGRTEKRDSRKNRGKSLLKSKVGRKCCYCHKEGHYKKECPERKKKAEKLNQKDSGDAVDASNDYDSTDVLVVSSSDSWK